MKPRLAIPALVILVGCPPPDRSERVEGPTFELRADRVRALFEVTGCMATEPEDVTDTTLSIHAFVDDARDLEMTLSPAADDANNAALEPDESMGPGLYGSVEIDAWERENGRFCTPLHLFEAQYAGSDPVAIEWTAVYSTTHTGWRGPAGLEVLITPVDSP
ncbi:MAG: hypothetical protein AAF721_11365 [Myxococcota bacterium]